jgi:drug/metabolite transporter (DMT)-like permease
MTPPTPTTSARPGEALAGTIAFIAAAGFGLIVVLARLSYDSGINPPTLLFFRAVTFCVGLIIILKALGRPIALPPTDRYASLGIGVVLAAETLCAYSAIVYIPVSLSVLLLYTYPLFVALGMRLMGRERLTPIKLAALLTAFAGLTLSLGASAGTLDPRGVFLGLASGIGLAIVVITSSHVMARVDSRRMSLHAIFAGSVIYAGALTLMDGFALPTNGAGWLLLGAIPAVYLIAELCFFTAIAMLGPSRMAMIGNLEPVTAILFASLLLAEALTPLRLAGAALVIGAVLAMQVFGRTRGT